ncbi:hypothetical protein [Sphingomonas sp.]|uniref:hypothetical protein n=1 Tax=Sphingomonas sp. TaxID=28214 RepID=UPI0025E2DDA4|nr:hypothetical protein [Sphingomonas sp.]
MTLFAYALLALATSTVPTGREPAPAADPQGAEYAQLTIQRRIFIRIPPTRIIPAPPPEIRPRWREKKGPKCIATTGLGGFAITTPDSIDLFLKGGGRYRAHLEDACPSIAFYSGFYIRPTEDGQICVGRDPIHSRAGGQCEIVRIRTLVPEH